MPDIYFSIKTVDVAVQQRLADTLEMRAADTQIRQMLHAYLSRIEFPQHAQVLEVGCGTGAVTRALAQWPRVAQATGVDTSPVFLSRARDLATGIEHIDFVEGDAQSLPFKDASFDVVVFHTVLCHLPEPSRALSEALRVLRPDGWLAVFDGDYATMTVATGKDDPLQACIEAAKEELIHDLWLVRRLPQLVREAGFDQGSLHSHGYLGLNGTTYLLKLFELGADLLVTKGRITQETAIALKREAQSRVETGTFFSFVSFASLLARKRATEQIL